jgi:GNAT superfamily N-acetyltransferase
MSDAAKPRNIPVMMVRSTLGGFPQPPMPVGYSTRLWRPGDDETWVRIERESDRFNEITRATFEREFGYDLAAMADRGLFLAESGGEDVGTATAWYGDEKVGRDWGRIHWVAIVPAHQGKGLAKPMLAAAMRRLAASHSKAYLWTSSARIPAIKVYLDFGFRPEMSVDKAEDGWREVRAKLKHPLLENAG